MLDFSPKPDASSRNRHKLGVLAFGSLQRDPGSVLGAMIMTRIKVKTPFPVEYGRYSGVTRGGAPTVVKHDAGVPVSAEVLVLKPEVSFEQARDALWNRERRREDSNEKYDEGRTSNSFLVRRLEDLGGVDSVLYTDFLDSGKVLHPNAEALALHAIDSVVKAKPGMDGITYLAANFDAGVVTRLTPQYIHELQQMLGVDDFGDFQLLARAVGRSQCVDDPSDLPYDARLLRACLASLALLALGHGLSRNLFSDWLDSLYGILEFTIGKSVHGKTQSTLAELVKRGRRPAGELQQIFQYLNSAESSPDHAWAYVEACVAQTLRQEA
jgi:hypothetical protein